MPTRSKTVALDDLHSIRARHPQSKIVHCHGVFDVLHAGHLAYFQGAKKFGDILVVTITSDEFVNKGVGRPYFNGSIRANMIAALEVVDYVLISRFPTAVPLIEKLKPDFYVKGPDYRDKSRDVTGAIFEEESAAERGDGRLVFTDDEVFSSSSLINKFFNPWTESQTQCLESVKREGGLEKIEQILEAVSREKVCIIGEPIIDTYVFCTPESISSKSPSISAKFLYEENYAGGSLAIANHLADFAKEVTLVVTNGNESHFSDLLADKLDKRVNLIPFELPAISTPRKTRFISHDKSQRIFEITNLRADQWNHYSPQDFCRIIKDANAKSTATILADFGHGLFEGSVLEAVAGFQGFVGLNVQTNSSNFGFNPFTKHRKFSYLSIDTKEVRIAYHDRFTPPLELASRMEESLNGKSFSVTLGSDGAYYFPTPRKSEIYAPAFADSVVDATGAGDAFFALTSLLVKADCPGRMVPFLGNVFAGLKTKILGNKTAVSRAQLMKAVTAVLK